MPSSENTPPHTAPKASSSDQTSKQQLDKLGNRLADVKVGLRKDAAMEGLTNALASKWEPNGIRKSSSGSADVDTKMTDGEGTAAGKP
jgi:hypothetical protein